MKMKKNWFKKLMTWLNLMNEEVFKYNNIFLKNISEISGDKIVLKNKSIDDFAKDYIWRTDPELATLDASYPLDISLSRCHHRPRPTVTTTTTRLRHYF